MRVGTAAGGGGGAQTARVREKRELGEGAGQRGTGAEWSCGEDAACGGAVLSRALR